MNLYLSCRLQNKWEEITNMTDNFKNAEISETILTKLEDKRSALNKRLEKLIDNFENNTSSPASLFSSLFEFAANTFISILNILLALFGLQIPKFGKRKSEKNDPRQRSASDIGTLTPSTRSIECRPEKLAVSRSGAMKNYLRLKNLNVPIPDSIYRNINKDDLQKLDRLSPAHIDALQRCSLELFKPKLREYSNQFIKNLGNLSAKNSNMTSKLADSFHAQHLQLIA